MKNAKKTKRLNEEEVKELVIDSLINNDTIETEELNKRARKVDKPQDAANIIKEYEETRRMKRKGIISVPYHQGKVFSRFREKKFMKLVNRFKIHINAIVFQINVFKLINKHSRLMKSSVNFSFFKKLRTLDKYIKKNIKEFE